MHDIMKRDKGRCYGIMLGNYEKRNFPDGEKVWLGRYKTLANVLHWHFEYEIIRIISGCAQIKIGGFSFNGRTGDCFFCAGEELHYIIGEPDSEIEIAILDEEPIKDITDPYTLLSPKLPDEIPIKEWFDRIKKERKQKGPFYREALENCARGLILDIFRNCPIKARDTNQRFYQNLIAKINKEFSFITFADAVQYSGYSPSHFSKFFKKLSGMSFSEYLNIIKVENAISLLRRGNRTMTAISQECGFSTVRNFNRVFKKITAYSPRLLPQDFVIDTGLRISIAESFDPTQSSSIAVPY